MVLFSRFSTETFHEKPRYRSVQPVPVVHPTRRSTPPRGILQVPWTLTSTRGVPQETAEFPGDPKASRWIPRGTSKTMGISGAFHEKSQRVALGTPREFPRNLPRKPKGIHELDKYIWYLNSLHAFRTR